jgi:hypothetical protein
MSNEVGAVKIKGVFLLTKNLFIMIYKFSNDGIDLEIELIQDKDGEKVLKEDTCISIKQSNDMDWMTIGLSKKNVYHLIGALHFLHKEMK